MGRILEDMVDSLKWKAKHYRSRSKVTFDKYADSGLVFLAANAAALKLWDMGIQSIADHTDKWEGMLTAAGHIAFAYLDYRLNRGITVKGRKYGIIPLARWMWNRRSKEERHRKVRTMNSWGRTGLQAAGMGALLLYLGLPNTLNNFSYDINRITHAVGRIPEAFNIAFSRTDGQQLFVEQDTTPVMADYPVQTNGDPIITGPLAGKTFHDRMLRDMTGLAGRVPDTAYVDFTVQLEKMWNNKQERFSNPVVDSFGTAIVDEYRAHHPTTMTINDYLRTVRTSLAEVNDHIDWDKVSRLKHLNKKETGLLQDIASSLNEKDIMSFYFTEIMPSTDGTFNMQVMDYLLRNAGREYVEAIPAQHDGTTSFGPGQFTSYALYDNDEVRRGASVINQALPDVYQIPGSVVKLRGNDHHKAAYLFAISNLADMINRLGRSRGLLARLETNWATNKDDIVQYVATAHHQPRSALQAAANWISNDAKYPFAISCNRQIKDYALKTDHNYQVLHRS